VAARLQQDALEIDRCAVERTVSVHVAPDADSVAGDRQIGIAGNLAGTWMGEAWRRHRIQQ
jgi:hypothetical protein